jgi:replication factor C subunit 3/5
MSGVPLVEYYRPKKFEDIVLDSLNKQILTNIIETSYFPNLLFYGPPGTGKTTTIINLINTYHAKLNIKNKDLIIHLNASDDRGIDIIRNQINCFVNSHSLFHTGMKFVILDEVDYMTKNAQQALKYLLQNFSTNVRFCLICNYISKIDEGLQNEFIKLRFNQLPKDKIINFLTYIIECEKINISKESIMAIQKLYNSDIRSMVNFIQSNINIDKDICILDTNVWNLILSKILQKEKVESIVKFIQEICIRYNIDKRNIMKDFLNYIIYNCPNYINSSFLNFVENLMHSKNENSYTYLFYSISKLCVFITSNQK